MLKVFRRQRLTCACVFVAFVCGLCNSALAAENSSAANIGCPSQLPGSETNTQNVLGLFVRPNRIADRGSDRILGDYLCGMPVILSVRVVNVAERKGRKNAVPVKVQGNWRDGVAFSVVNKEGVLVPTLTPQPLLHGAKGEAESTVVVFHNELWDYWFIDSGATAHLKGDYRLASGWKDATAREIRLQFREPESDEDRAKVLMAQAEEQMLLKHFSKAGLLLEEVVKRRGENFQDGDLAVLVLMGDAFAAANRPREALKAYKKYVASWREASEPEVVLWKISRLEKQLSSQTETPTEPKLANP